ncbi:MAG TPA: hypothetical protein VG142_18985 [Trebonia sp.]|jgi:ABC-type nitrate/sulfonate/bicarbonate transport system ATPase subunit|nr:hypothetical protein [Trebonia sp.]
MMTVPVQGPAVRAPVNVAVSARNVTRAFGDRRVLRGLEITIAPGEFVALLGRSGTGNMHGLLQDLCARHHPAVLLVTHDVDEAILLADRGHAESGALRTRLLEELGVSGG